MPTGTVSRLWRWPVKSMAGEEVRALSLDARGVGGDRTHAVLHEHKGTWRPLTAREAPRLLAWSAAYPFNLDAGLDPASPPHAIVTRPDGRRSWRWGDPRLRSALEADLGRPVELLRELGGVPDVPGQLLLTTEATLRALSEELGTAVDLRRFRTNLHLELDAAAWAELGWEGAQAVFAGGVRLRLVEPCERCAIPTRDPDTYVKWAGLLAHLAARHGQNLGIRARVIAGGRVAAGERVRIETAGASGSPRTGR
ncbi:MAG: MOSC domain-containing protein [Solirubrobacteraceae bacterium]